MPTTRARRGEEKDEKHARGVWAKRASYVQEVDGRMYVALHQRAAVVILERRARRAQSPNHEPSQTRRATNTPTRRRRPAETNADQKCGRSTTDALSSSSRFSGFDHDAHARARRRNGGWGEERCWGVSLASHLARPRPCALAVRDALRDGRRLPPPRHDHPTVGPRDCATFDRTMRTLQTLM